MRRVSTVLTAIMCLLLVAALASRTPAASVPEVLIGDVLPLTGNFASLGQQYLWAGQTVEDIINNDYPDLAVPLGPGKGFPGLGGAPAKFIFRDDQSRGDLARTIAEQLITVNRVHWLNGDGTSGNTSIIQPVVESYGIPMSCHPCASPTLTEKGMKWYWRTGPNDRTMVASLFSFLKEWPEHGGPKGLKTVAVFTCDNLFCQDNRKIANELLPRLGFEIVLDLTTKTGATTLASEVQRLQAAKPDILFLVQCRPSWKKVNEIYKTYSRGQTMGELAMREITGLLWMADTINRAKSVEPAALAQAAMDTNTPPEQLIIDYKGIRFNQNHQNELATGVVTQIGWDGEKHTVWPWELAKRANFKILYPNPGWQERDSTPKPAE